MANIDATQYASAMLNTLRSSKEKQSVKEVTSSAKKLPMVSRYYGTTNEMLKDMYSGTRNFNDEMFAEAAKRGELNEYFMLLEANKDILLDDKFYDMAYYNYETNIGELSKILADDTEKSLTDRKTTVFDPATGEYIEQDIGKMTDKQYLDYQIEQSRLYRSQEIQFDLEKYQKESMDGWLKFVNSAGQVLAEAAEGVVQATVKTIDFFGALGYSVYQGISHASGQIFEDSFVEYYRSIGLTPQYMDSVRAGLDEWERRYGWIKNVDGSSTSLGGILAGIANSFGQMVPGILVGILTGGASIPFMVGGKTLAKLPLGFATFYTGMFSGNMYENATNPALKDTPSSNLILNAGLKAVSQAVIEWGLGKILGGTVANNLLGLGSRGLIQGAKAITKGAIAGFVFKSAAQEGLEEFLQDMGDMLIDTAFAQQNDGYTSGIDWQQLLDSFIVGAASSLILSGMSVGSQEIVSGLTKGNNRFDIFYTKNGKTKKVRGFSRLLWREMLNEYNENIEAIQNGTLSEKATVKTLQGVFATYQTLGQFFDGISEERIAKAMSLFNSYINNQNVVNERFQKAQWLKENFGTDVDPDSLVDLDALEKVRTQTMNEYVSQLSGDVSRVLIDAKITGVALAAVKKDVKAIIKKNKEKLVDNDVTEVVRAVDKNGETVGTNDQSSIVDAKMEKYKAQQKSADTKVEDLWKKSQKTVDGLSKDYAWIFTTDGRVALEDGKYLFVPETWLENYTPTEIKEFLVQARVVETFQTDETFKSIYEAMIKSYKEFTGADLRKGDIHGAERVILDTLFNEAVFQHFLLTNIHKFVDKDTKVNYLFGLAYVIKALSKEYVKDDPLKKQLLDKIYNKIKQTMRRPIMKAVINWNMDPQIAGATDVLNQTDMQYINAYMARKATLQGGTSKSAYFNLREKIMPRLLPYEREIVEKADRENASIQDKLLAMFILDNTDMSISQDRKNFFVNNEGIIKFSNDLSDIVSNSKSDKQLFINLLTLCAYNDEVLRQISDIIDVEEFFATFSYIGAKLGIENANELFTYINDYDFNNTELQNAVKSFLPYIAVNYDYIINKLENLTQRQIKQYLHSFSLKLQTILSGLYTQEFGNTKGFNIPLQVFTAFTTPAEQQFIVDVETKFQQIFTGPLESVYIKSHYDSLETLVKKEYITQIQEAYINSGITNLSDFILYYYQNMLGDGYTVFPDIISSISKINIVKSVPAAILFNKNVLNYDYKRFFKKTTRSYYYNENGDYIKQHHTVFEATLRQLLNLNFIKNAGLSDDFLNTKIILDNIDKNALGYYDGTSIVLHDINDRGTLYHEINHVLADEYNLPRGLNNRSVKSMYEYLKEIYTFAHDYLINYYTAYGQFDIVKVINKTPFYIIYSNNKYNKNYESIINMLAYMGYSFESGEYLARYYTHNKTVQTYRKETQDLKKGPRHYVDVLISPISGKRFVVPDSDRYAPNIKPSDSIVIDETYQQNTIYKFFAEVIESHDNLYMDENTNTNYHTAFTGNVIELLDDILSDSISSYMRGFITLDQVIKNPNVYLKKDILDQIEDKSEGGIYRFLQNYYFKQNTGYNIDRHKDTHQYIFVNDNSFDNLLSDEAYEAGSNEDSYNFVEKYNNKIVKISQFYRPQYYNALNLPTDIEVEIGPNVKYTQTVFNDTHKNGKIFIKTDEFTTDAELVNKINHEFRHLLQHYNRLEGGFTNNFKVTPELVADIKKYYPSLFTNKTIRNRFKTDESIVRQFVYFMIGGEQNAYAFNYDILIGKPWYATYEGGKGYLFAPWYDGKNGRYQVDIAGRMIDDAHPSNAKGFKLSQRGTATHYKGKGKRITIDSEVVGEPTIKTNKKTGKQTIIPNVRETVIYQYDKKGVYLSKKRATKIINGQTSNLQYFWKKGGDNQMPPDMQDFIEATTGHEMMLPKGLVGAIRKGTLTKDELMAWFRSVDLTDDKAINDFTFELLNEHIFKNNYLKSKEDLGRLVDLDIANWYAAYKVIKASGAKYDWLLRENTVEGFSNFVSTMADSSFKDDFEEAKKEFQQALKFENGKYVPTEVDQQIRQYMRVATMLLFDGTLQNAMTLAGYFRTFTKHFADRALGRRVVSLDGAQNGQNKTAGHGGESEEGASLGDTLDARKSTSGGAIRNPFSNTIEETYIENSDNISPDEAIKSLATVEYEQTFGESSNNNIERVIKALKSKKIDTNEKKKLANKLNSLVKKTLDSIARKKKKALAEADFDFVSMLDKSTNEETDISDTKQIDILYDNKLLDFQDALRDYITGKISTDEMVEMFRDIMLENYSMKYADMSIEELNARYDATRMNQLLPDDMQIDVTSSEKWSRRNTQQNIKTRVRQINQFVRKGEIVWETLPKDIQNMFEIKTVGKGRNKLEYYVLKEEYYIVDKSKKGEDRFAQIKATYDALNTIYQQAKKGAFLKTEVAAEMRKNLATIERSNRRKQREQAKTESKFIETVYNYKKKIKAETTQKVKNAPIRTEVSVNVGSEIELPEKLNKLFTIGFEGMADTEVQFASQDAEGKLYEKGDTEFESRLQHEIVSWDIFYEYNREILANLTREDVIDIVEAVQKGIWAMGDLDAQRKVLAFQIFTIGYILSGARNNIMQWNLSDAEVDSIRGTYERLASVAGTGLNSVKQMLDTVNPLRKVQQEMLEDWDIDPEQSQPLFDAITNFTNAENDEARIKASEEVARQLGIIEGLMKQHQLNTKLSRKADKERQKALRDKWQGDLDQYKAAEARWKKLKAEGNDKQAGPKPQRPDKPKALRVNILDNPLYKGLMNWRYTAMLSNPATWVRNIVSNTMVKGINKASDAVSNVVFDIAKKGYRADQWDLSGRTKVSEDVNTFVDNLVNSIMYTDEKGKDKRLFDLLYDGTSKYSDRMKLKTGADLFSALVVQAVEAKYAATHRFNNGALNRVANFVSDRIKDTRFIKSAANKYFKKILQIEVNKGNIDLSKPLSRETLDLFAEAVILASQDFMHKESALGTMMNSLKEKHPNAYAVANIFFPFLNASFNWFTESLKMSPFGLAKAIWNSAHLETMITNIDEKRANGQVLPSTKAVQYLVRRDIGKGIIGSILWGLGAILAAVGWIRIEEEDDKPYVYISDIKLDIGDIFGSSSLLVGAAIVSVAGRDEATFDDILGTTFNLLLDGFIGKDLWETSRWNNNMYEFMLSYTESFMKSFVPQIVQLIIRATNNHNITYGSGILGSIQRWLNSFVPTQLFGDKRVNPYTGELETKYAIPFLGEILKSGLFGIRIVWEDVSAGEILAKEYGVNKNPIEAEITINGVKTSLGDKNQLNQYYGKLNANSLSELQNERHLVEMPDGSFETLSWKQMTDDQRKNVIERTFTKNATYAKVYMWTQVLNRKYYTNNETRKILQELGITSNVYLGDKGYVE